MNMQISVQNKDELNADEAINSLKTMMMQVGDCTSTERLGGVLITPSKN